MLKLTKMWKMFFVYRYIRNWENPTEFYEDIQFKKRYRFSKRAVVDILLSLINNELQRNDNRGLPISPLMQLLITLRFYTTSSFQVYFILLPNLYILFIIYHIFYVLVFQIVSGDMRGISQALVSRIVTRVSKIIALHLGQYVNFSTPEDKI